MKKKYSIFNIIKNSFSNNENWNTGEPNSSGDENIGEIYASGNWNDEKETTLNQRYLLEVDQLISSKSGYTFLGQYDGHSYFSSNLSFLWYAAKADAQANGGYLAMIKTKEENDTIATMLSSKLHFGLYQDVSDKYFKEPKGGWKWVDGTPLTFENWNSGEPNNAGSEEYGHFTGSNHLWNDLPLSLSLIHI